MASHRVISYHRVKPSRAGREWRDRRCRILAEYKRRESGPANWYSRCLPHFAVLGTPKSGTTSLFNPNPKPNPNPNPNANPNPKP